MKTGLAADLEQFAADHVWIDENRDALLARYADQWIAVRDAQVIASDPDLSNLIARLPDPPHTCIEFLGREPVEMIL